MQNALNWLTKNHEGIVRGLADLVAVKSISTDGEHKPEIERTASLTCQQMREAGLHNVDVLRTGDSLPYAYGEWLGAPASRRSSCMPITTCNRSTRSATRRTTGNPTPGR